jgi:hypothetical protein
VFAEFADVQLLKHFFAHIFQGVRLEEHKDSPESIVRARGGRGGALSPAIPIFLYESIVNHDWRLNFYRFKCYRGVLAIPVEKILEATP